MRVIVVLLCLLAGTQLMSQSEIEPELRFIKSTGTSGPDVLQLRVPKPTALAPSGLVSDTSGLSEMAIEPFWAVLWIFGNGDFLYDTLSSTPDAIVGDTFIYNKLYAYQDGTSVQPMALMTAVYSRDRNSLVALPDPVGPTPSSSPTVYQTVATLFEHSKYTSLILPWPTVRPKDAIVLGINYRKPNWINGSSGEIELSFDTAQVSCESIVFAGQNPMPTASGGSSGRVRWAFDDFTGTGHRTFFVALNVKDIPLGANRDSLSLKVSINWDGEIVSTDNIVGMHSGSFGILGSKKQISYTSEVLADGQIEETVSIEVDKSNDPNKIRITPLCFVANWDGSQEASIEVDFMNKGNAPVRSLRIYVEYSVDQWKTTRSDAFYYPNAPVFDFIRVEARETPGIFEDRFVAKSGQSILLSVEEAALLRGGTAEEVSSASLSDEKLMDQYGTLIGGHVKFKMNTLPRLRVGDSLWMRVIIEMDGVQVKDSIKVGICRFCGPRPKAQYGVRTYGNALSTELLKSGYGARFTLMMPLQRIRRHVATPIISADMLPDWWLQWEAGISQTRFQNGGSTLDFGYIDFVPLQLRWIPSKLPGYLRNKHVGLSASYTISYAYRARTEGNAFEFKSSGDRLDYTIGASVDFLNMLGRSGFSLGAGYNYRWTQYNGSPQNYGYALMYVHYNFPYRLSFN